MRKLVSALRGCRDALAAIPEGIPGAHDHAINRAIRRAEEALKPFWREKMLNMYVSDLYFNHDKSECEKYDRGNFAGYDEVALAANAEGFAVMVKGLCGDEIAPADLVADFYHRL